MWESLQPKWPGGFLLSPALACCAWVYTHFWWIFLQCNHPNHPKRADFYMTFLLVNFAVKNAMSFLPFLLSWIWQMISVSVFTHLFPMFFLLSLSLRGFFAARNVLLCLFWMNPSDLWWRSIHVKCATVSISSVVKVRCVGMDQTNDTYWKTPPFPCDVWEWGACGQLDFRD